MDRRTTICLWVIIIGLANFMAYTLIYMFIGGEAVNGMVVSNGQRLEYFLAGAKMVGDQQSQPSVSRAVFLYSGIHSISIWVTVAAIMLAMLTLARERIISSMHSTIVRGRTFITILATLITFTTSVITIWFALQFVKRLSAPEQFRPAIMSAPTSMPSATTSPVGSVNS